MSDSETSTKAAAPRLALLACLALMLLLGLGLLNVWFRGSAIATRPPSGGQNSLSTDAAAEVAAEDAWPQGSLASDATGEAAAVAGPATVGPSSSEPEPRPTDQADEAGSVPSSAQPDAAAVAAELPPLPAGPWTAALAAAGEPPVFEKVCFDDFDAGRSLPLPQDVEDWFARVPGERLEIRAVRTRPGETARFEGLMRLKLPWRPDVALRLNLTDFDRLQIHLFAGESGTTLAYYVREHPRWAAYLTTRKTGQPRPETFVAAATDDARTRRTRVHEGASIALRCQKGQAILSHGDVVLLRAPLAALPDEVYFEGQATFYGIAAVRSAPPPEMPQPDPASFATERPADLPWSEQLAEGARLERQDDGALELLASGSQQPGWVAAPLDLPGVCEVVLQLDQATAGTGVFLGPGETRPAHALRFLNDKTSRGTGALVRDFDAREMAFPAVREAFVPFAPAAPWVRLLFACGTLHCWTSPDGVHWVGGEKYGGDLTEPATHVGLMHQGGVGEARIRLRSLQVRPLPEFNALADPDLVRQAMPPERFGSLGEWLTWTTEQQPPDVDSGRWRRASAVRTLTHGCPRLLGTRLIELLMDDAADGGLPPDRQLALFGEAARLLTVRDDHAQREALLSRYHALGMDAFRQAGRRPYSLIRHQLLSVPLAAHDDLRVAREETIRAEMVQLSHEDRWPELLDFCRQLRFFRQTDAAPLLDWAEATALRHLPQGAGGQRLVGRKQDWAPPWIEELSRPSYNFLAELQAMLDSGAWQDAGRFVVGLDSYLLPGLATHAQDARRHLSLPTAIRTLLADWPQLQDVIRQQHGDLAALRIHSAVQRGDVAALELSAIQFAGTEAAARAHQWLGDRALAGGWFTTALAEYQRGEATADPISAGDLANRRRLAAAMQGQRLEGKAEGEVVLGQYRMSAEEFERLIDEMAGSRAEPAVVIDSDVAVPPPGGYRIQRRGRLDGPIGKDPGEQATPHVGRIGAEWVGRQLGTAIAEDTLYVSNRFHVAAYDLSDGGRRWQAAPDGGTPLRSRDWGLIAMRPLITRERIFTRLLYEPAPQLVCLDRASGQQQWAAELAQNQSVASDPLMVQGQLAAFTILRQEQGTSLLRLSLFDPESGRLQTEYDLLRVNDVWWRRRCCEVTVVDDTLVAAISGVTFCCDLSGNLRWLRRQTVLPPDEAPHWVTQSFQRPIRIGDHLFVVQPGVQALECLESSSGRAVWTRILPGIRRLIGRSEDRLIVEVDEALAALDTASGETRWEYPAAGILQAAACDAQRVLFAQPAASRREALKEGCHLVWLDAATGRVAGSTALADLNVADPRMGPMIFRPDRIWTYFVAGKDDAAPEWIELIPEGSAELSQELADGRDAWTRHLAAELVQTVRRRFPGWELISGERDKRGPIEPERSGRTDVLVAQARHGHPLVFARAVSVPASGQPRLRLTTGHAGVRDWVLEVRFSGQVLYREEISGRSLNEPWKTAEIDLSPAAGRRGQLIIEAQFRGGGDAVELFWSDIEIVF